MPPKFLVIQKNNHHHGSIRTGVALCCSFLFEPLLAHERRRPGYELIEPNHKGSHFMWKLYGRTGGANSHEAEN